MKLLLILMMALYGMTTSFAQESNSNPNNESEVEESVVEESSADPSETRSHSFRTVNVVAGADMGVRYDQPNSTVSVGEGQYGVAAGITSQQTHLGEDKPVILVIDAALMASLYHYPNISGHLDALIGYSTTNGSGCGFYALGGGRIAIRVEDPEAITALTVGVSGWEIPSIQNPEDYTEEELLELEEQALELRERATNVAGQVRDIPGAFRNADTSNTQVRVNPEVEADLGLHCSRESISFLLGAYFRHDFMDNLTRTGLRMRFVDGSGNYQALVDAGVLYDQESGADIIMLEGGLHLYRLVGPNRNGFIGGDLSVTCSTDAELCGGTVGVTGGLNIMGIGQ